MKGNKYVQLAFAIAGLITWILVAKFFGFLFEVLAPDANLALLGEQFRISDLVGLVSGAATWIALRANANVVEFSREVATELSKVNWPTSKEVKLSTVVVVVTSVVMAVICGVFDYVWAFLTSFIYGA
jgi:preprotein translocase subunit SecE